MEKVILIIKLKLKIYLVIIIFQIYIQKIILVIELRAKKLVSLKYKLIEVKIIKN